MAKRLIEFNVGDPKSNQQTASKVDCTITINNTNEKIPENEPKEISKEVPKEVESSKPTATESETLRDFEVTFNPKINLALAPKSRALPTSAERYIVVSRQPIITAEEIENNMEFMKTLNKILVNTLINNDKKLLANIIDGSGKIILSASDLCDLIAVMLSTEDFEVTNKQVSISYQESFTSSCFRLKISPFKSILTIKVDNQDLYNLQNEAYNVLTDKFMVSLDTVFIE